LKLWQPPVCDVSVGTRHALSLQKQNLCCDDKALAVARRIADKLQIPFYVLKVDNLFKKEIVDNFISEYEKGNTPNPCVRCNRYIKFGYLWEKARQLKADYLATGHYVRQRRKITNNKLQITNKSQIQNSKKIQNKNLGNCDLEFVCNLELDACDFSLVRSKDENKDQTYFLSTIDPAVIPHLIFPLGGMTKKEVREIARRAKLPVYNKKDSMGVCFIPDGDAMSFLKQFTKKLQKSGQIVDKYGNVLSQHKGLLGYTIGEKLGDDEVAARYKKITNNKLQITNKSQIQNSKKTRNKNLENCDLEFVCNLELGACDLRGDIPRLYVTKIDVKKNQLIVGENADCFSREMEISDWHQVNVKEKLKFGKDYSYLIQIRGGHKPEAGRVKGIKKDKLIIEFKKPVRAITPGQTAVVYKKNILIGGGIIIS